MDDLSPDARIAGILGLLDRFAAFLPAACLPEGCTPLSLDFTLDDGGSCRWSLSLYGAGGSTERVSGVLDACSLTYTFASGDVPVTGTVCGDAAAAALDRLRSSLSSVRRALFQAVDGGAPGGEGGRLRSFRVRRALRCRGVRLAAFVRQGPATVIVSSLVTAGGLSERRATLDVQFPDGRAFSCDCTAQGGCLEGRRVPSLTLAFSLLETLTSDGGVGQRRKKEGMGVPRGGGGR